MPLFKDTIEKRLKDPFMGPFIFLLLIINYETTFKLIYGLDPHSKSTAIKELFKIDNFLCWLIYPLLYTTLYIFALPWLAYWISKYQEWMRQKKINAFINIEANENFDWLKAQNDQLNDLIKSTQVEWNRFNKSLVQHLNGIKSKEMLDSVANGKGALKLKEQIEQAIIDLGSCTLHNLEDRSRKISIDTNEKIKKNLDSSD